MNLYEQMTQAVVDNFNKSWIEEFEQLDRREQRRYLLTKDGQLMQVHWKDSATTATCAPFGGGSSTTVNLRDVEARGMEAIKKYLEIHKNWRWANFHIGTIDEEHRLWSTEDEVVLGKGLLQGFLRNGAFRWNGYAQVYFPLETLELMKQFQPDDFPVEFPSEENGMKLIFPNTDYCMEGVMLNGPEGIVEAWGWPGKLNEIDGPDRRRTNYAGPIGISGDD